MIAIRFAIAVLSAFVLLASKTTLAASSDAGCSGEAPAIQASFQDMAIRKESGVEVIYVGAWDCVFCSQWKTNSKAEWLASSEAKRVRYREVEAPSVRDICYDDAWPQDLAWIKAAVKLRGVPRWLVVVDGQVVGNFFGLEGFEKLNPRLRTILEKLDRAN